MVNNSVVAVTETTAKIRTHLLTMLKLFSKQLMCVAVAVRLIESAV